MPTPHVFVRDHPSVPGRDRHRRPYAIVISSRPGRAFTPDELRFLVGRELGAHRRRATRKLHLAAARPTGARTRVVAVAFGAWLRTIEYTADRAGLLCCGSLNAAISAMATWTFQHARPQDGPAHLRRAAARAGTPSRRCGWASGWPRRRRTRPTGSRRWARSRATRSSAGLWSARFAQRRDDARGADCPSADDERKGFAGPGRRVAALAIDFAVISALVPDLGRERRTGAAVRSAAAPVKAVVTDSDAQQALAQAPPAVSHAVNAASAAATGRRTCTSADWLVRILLAAYVVVLVLESRARRWG